MVQGTINGYGERCGNANLCSVIPNLKLKYGLEVVTPDQLKSLKDTSHYISEVLNLTPFDFQPFVGHSSFTHKGGVHVDAVMKVGESYEHIKPGLVGNRRRIVVSTQAGRKTIFKKALELGIDLKEDTENADKILVKVEELEGQGYSFEAADGSLFMLIQKELGHYKPFFDLESFKVDIDKLSINGHKVMTDAIVKIKISGERLSANGEGDGPINALDLALRKALNGKYLALNSIKLTDYKVRVLNSQEGTAAKVRVWIESSNGKDSWGTVGVHENIVEASWQALVDSYEYGLSITK